MTRLLVDVARQTAWRAWWLAMAYEVARWSLITGLWLGDRIAP